VYGSDGKRGEKGPVVEGYRLLMNLGKDDVSEGEGTSQALGARRREGGDGDARKLPGSRGVPSFAH